MLTWKTLLPCAQTAAEVVGFLRSDAPAHLTRVDAPAARDVAAIHAA